MVVQVPDSLVVGFALVYLEGVLVLAARDYHVDALHDVRKHSTEDCVPVLHYVRQASEGALVVVGSHGVEYQDCGSEDRVLH
eukprot:CAMPEP_0173176698 /NCGR_PEP_ID=MMETSP1141-20130122/4605_1 /TAXON_ID=483371 /ORGANISM="non described non described, Strain CCMP2298" /LENGTH=81 /DNA_ID=CAMNT_0014099067 /DNA_START=258 /DNA_END=503 /DNA_ORIENTATION=-